MFIPVLAVTLFGLALCLHLLQRRRALILSRNPQARRDMLRDGF